MRTTNINIDLYPEEDSSKSLIFTWRNNMIDWPFLANYTLYFTLNTVSSMAIIHEDILQWLDNMLPSNYIWGYGHEVESIENVKDSIQGNIRNISTYDDINRFSQHLYFRFKTEEDLLLFKLTWGNSAE